LAHPFNPKALRLVRYLNGETDIAYGSDEMLFEILHHDFYGIPPIEIAKLTVEVNRRRYNNEDCSIRKLLYDRAQAPAKDLFDAGFNPAMKSMSGVIESLIAGVPNLTLQQLFEQLINKTGILDHVMKSESKIALLKLLTAFFDFIKDESARDPLLSLKQFIAVTDLMEKENIPLPLTQVTGNEQGVNLLTAHDSKGLEFDNIFFAGLNASAWGKNENPEAVTNYPIPCSFHRLQVPTRKN